jgi:hypothetical protein
MENLYGLIPLILFTLVAILYHIGHNEYDKKYGDKNGN